MPEEESKARILAAATAVFSAKGFAKASMNDIVRASGLSKGGVYWHFSSKDELVEAIFDQFFAGQQIILDELLASEQLVANKLLQLATITAREAEAMVEQAPSPLEFYALATRDDKLMERMVDLFRAYQEKLTMLIEQGSSSGEFRLVSAAQIANTLIGLVEGVILLWSVMERPFDLQAQLTAAVQTMLSGLQKDNQ
jgi:AcrR family transcriptional regulator